MTYEEAKRLRPPCDLVLVRPATGQGRIDVAFPAGRRFLLRVFEAGPHKGTPVLLPEGPKPAQMAVWDPEDNEEQLSPTFWFRCEDLEPLA